jgi:hypothetical protein
MRYRQVHLDFHTSEKIPAIAAAFDPARFQTALRLGHIDSITIFAKCHHGWHYHPTAAGRLHPHLGFDLLKAQIEAAHAIGVKTPVYLSAGLDEQTYWREPGWARREANGSVPWAGSNDKAGFHEMCMNSPYLDQLAAQVEETARNYDVDGIFLDIVGPRPCWCCRCVTERLSHGDAADPALIATQSRRVYLAYTRRMREALDRAKPGARIFHNAGHITRGDLEIARQNTHLELESLPTGGWGYDHFPLSAGYARTTGMEFLGMTGKFHLSWGEFGGFKHPNALRYEAAAAIAQGAAVSVGDQLHPDGAMEEATYATIGAAFAEVEAKEPWIGDVRSLAEVALLSYEAIGQSIHEHGKGNGIDEGAVRMLLEGHVWFDVVDKLADWSRYKLLVLPDAIRPDQALATKLLAYVQAGGRILATGTSGLRADSDEQILDFGAVDAGPSPFAPEYIVPVDAVGPWPRAAFVVYGAGRRLQLRGGTVLAEREEPYFNRALGSFCSHQHTPNRRGAAGPAIVAGPHGTWIAHPICQLYLEKGQQILRELFMQALRRELGGLQIDSNLPSAGRLTLMRQNAQRRDVLHILFATPVKRGNGVEVIEDLTPLADVHIAVRRASKPSAVRLVPDNRELPYDYADGRVSFSVPQVICHQMVELAD